jgi:DNA-binding response OmpR family regulator
MTYSSFKDKKVLILEEEEPLKRLMQIELSSVCSVEAPAAAPSILKLVQKYNPDLIIVNIDSKYEEGSGIKLCEKIRFNGSDAWLIAVSSKASISDKVGAMGLGADDFFVKPFSSEELIARIKAMLRRTLKKTQEGILTYSDLKMDLINRGAWRKDTAISLRSKEFELLKVFMLKPEEVLSREFIFDQVWGTHFLGDSNVIEVYIRYLRSKLGKPDLIKTRRGNGYILISDEAQINQSASSFDF